MYLQCKHPPQIDLPYKRMLSVALASLAQWIGRWPADCRVPSSVKGMYLPLALDGARTGGN